MSRLDSSGGACVLLIPVLVFLSSIPSFGSDFVVRDGAKFRVGESPFSFLGTNAYYLFMDAARGDTQAVVDLFSAAQGTGMTVIRTWAFNDGPDSLDPAVIQYRPGRLNETALRGLDYVVAQASKFKIRLLLVLVNSWDDYGGMNRYAQWRSVVTAVAAATDAPAGESPAKYSADQRSAIVNGPAGRSYRVALDGSWSHDDFYTDSIIGSWYRNYLMQITDRTNTITGVAYRDDPAIFGWELANEPRSSDRSGTIVRNWLSSMSGYLKGIDPNHLIGTGEEGFDVVSWIYSTTQYNGQEWLFDGTEGVSFSMNTDLPSVDYGSIHLYPEYWNLPAGSGSGWIADHIRASERMGKPLILGEFGIRSDRAAVYESWLNAAVVDGAAGAIVWQLLHPGRTDPEGFGMYCPGDGSACGVLAEAAARFALRDTVGLLPPPSFALLQNYPNPFNSRTIIRYHLPEDTHVVLDIWDVSGRKVETLFEGFQNAGERIQIFDPEGFASGAYFYRIATPGRINTRKLIILR